jgi:hypothetical protein
VAQAADSRAVAEVSDGEVKAAVAGSREEAVVRVVEGSAVAADSGAAKKRCE